MGRHRSGGWPAGSLAAVLVVATLVVGCNGSGKSWDDPGPATTFERFLMHWFKDEQAEAFEMIRPEDRETLTASLEVVEKKVGSAVLRSHEMLVAGRVDNPYDLKDIEVDPKLETEPDPGQQVTLSLVYHDGRSATAEMVWDGERWFVGLPLGDEADRTEADDGGAPAEGRPKKEKASDPKRPSTDATGSSDAVSGDSRE